VENIIHLKVEVESMMLRCVSETATELASRQTSPTGLFIGLIVVVFIVYLFTRCFDD